MRTNVEEIAAYYQDQKARGNDPLGFLAEVLVPHLPFRLANAHLKADVKAEDWDAGVIPLDEKLILTEMREYMAFALEKVCDHRGISAGRSVQKMGGYLFLLGDDELLRVAEDPGQYAQYGAPILKRICEQYQFPFPAAEWFTRMARGELCREGCEEGCAR